VKTGIRSRGQATSRLVRVNPPLDGPRADLEDLDYAPITDVKLTSGRSSTATVRPALTDRGERGGVPLPARSVRLGVRGPTITSSPMMLPALGVGVSAEPAIGA